MSNRQNQWVCICLAFLICISGMNQRTQNFYRTLLERDAIQSYSQDTYTTIVFEEVSLCQDVLENFKSTHSLHRCSFFCARRGENAHSFLACLGCFRYVMGIVSKWDNIQDNNSSFFDFNIHMVQYIHKFDGKK